MYVYKCDMGVLYVRRGLDGVEEFKLRIQSRELPPERRRW
jgi:hypothetical protein